MKSHICNICLFAAFFFFAAGIVQADVRYFDSQGNPVSEEEYQRIVTDWNAQLSEIRDEKQAAVQAKAVIEEPAPETIPDSLEPARSMEEVEEKPAETVTRTVRKKPGTAYDALGRPIRDENGRYIEYKYDVYGRPTRDEKGRLIIYTDAAKGGGTAGTASGSAQAAGSSGSAAKSASGQNPPSMAGSVGSAMKNINARKGLVTK